MSTYAEIFSEFQYIHHYSNEFPFGDSVDKEKSTHLILIKNTVDYIKIHLITFYLQSSDLSLSVEYKLNYRNKIYRCVYRKVQTFDLPVECR